MGCDPQRADQQVWQGQAGICESWRRWLDQWDDWSFEIADVEDQGDRVFVVGHEHGRGQSSGANVSATNYMVLTFRDGKISRYQEFYDEQQARAALTASA